MISSFNGLILKNTDQGGESQRRATTEGGSCAYQLLGSVLPGIYDPQGDPVHLTREAAWGSRRSRNFPKAAQLIETMPGFQPRSTWF